MTNNTVSATTGPVVVDYLPAWLEFLGCGGSFNSTTPEYPAATNTVTAVPGCETPASVDTVENPAGKTPENERVLRALSNLRRFMEGLVCADGAG